MTFLFVFRSWSIHLINFLCHWCPHLTVTVSINILFSQWDMLILKRGTFSIFKTGNFQSCEAGVINYIHQITLHTDRFPDPNVEYGLEVWFSTFIILWPFHMVPRLVVIPHSKTIFITTYLITVVLLLLWTTICLSVFSDTLR